MFLRWLIGIVIVGFWLVMTVLLVRMAYFPDDSRLALESPQVVMERFLTRARNSDLAPDELDIWKGREIVGSLRVEPQFLPVGEQRELHAKGQVRIDGRLLVNLPFGGDTDLILTAVLAMDNNSDVKRSDVLLRLDRYDLTLQILEKGNGAAPVLKLTQHEVELLNTGTAGESSANADKFMVMILSGLGMSPADIAKRQATAKAEAAGTVTEARRGGFEVRGKQFNGYKLTTTLGGAGDRKFILSISDSGELLQMKTSFLDYDFVTDSLRPAGMVSYENQKLQDIQKNHLPAPAPPLPK